MTVRGIYLFFFLCGVAYAKHRDGNETLIDKILPELRSRLGDSVALPGLAHEWVERTAFIFTSDCSLTCRPGKAATLTSLENYNLETLREGRGTAFLGFSNLQFKYDQCELVVLSTTGLEREYGMLGDHRLLMKISYSNNQSSCLVKVDSFIVELLDNVMINDSTSMKLLKSYGQYDIVLEKIRASVMKNLNETLAKTAGMEIVVPGRCEDME